nr:MAG TPA: hypothetical protein [Caudoviricetes sp.]
MAGPGRQPDQLTCNTYTETKSGTPARARERGKPHGNFSPHPGRRPHLRRY